MRLTLAILLLALPCLGVENSNPAHPPLTLGLEELWRVGGDDGALLFGAVAETATDDAGNVYLLDSQLCRVVVIAPDGTHLRTLSREGDGPGEVRRPRDLVLLPDDSIGLMTMFPAKLVRLTRTGEPLPSLEFSVGEGGLAAGNLCLSRGGALVLGATLLSPTEHGQNRRFLLAAYDADGIETTRYCESGVELDFRKLHFVERRISPGFHNNAALGPDGRVFTAPDWNAYRIEVHAPDGALERTISRPFDPRPRTADEMRRVEEVFAASARNAPVKQTQELEPNAMAITDLYVDPEHRLWVEHSRSGDGLPVGVMTSYDQFSPEGRWLRRIHVACDGDVALDGLRFLDDGRVLLLKGLTLAETAQTDLGSVPLGEEGEASNMEFVCYRVVE